MNALLISLMITVPIIAIGTVVYVWWRHRHFLPSGLSIWIEVTEIDVLKDAYAVLK